MKLKLLFDHRFFRDSEGRIFSAQNYNYSLFANRYLEVFDEVDVVARISENTRPTVNMHYTEGPGVQVVSVGDWHGPKQYIQKRFQIHANIMKTVSEPTATIMILPGTIGSAAYKQLIRTGRPYGVEVVGDPYAVFAPGVVDHPLRPFLRWWFTRNLRHQCLGACASTYVTTQTIQKRYPPHAETFTTNVSDVQLSDEAFAIASRVFHVPPTPARLLIVGSLEQMYKAPDVLLHAVARCVERGLNLQLTVIGQGKHQQELVALAGSLGVAGYVQFLGQLPAGAAVRSQLDQADVFVLPSRTEGLPRALIEAMARGLPCIGSTVGGIPELLPQEDMVPPNDVIALAQKIEEVICNPARMTAMSARNLEHARSYHEDILRKRRIEFYTYVRDQTQVWINKRT